MESPPPPLVQEEEEVDSMDCSGNGIDGAEEKANAGASSKLRLSPTPSASAAIQESRRRPQRTLGTELLPGLIEMVMQSRSQGAAKEEDEDEDDDDQEMEPEQLLFDKDIDITTAAVGVPPSRTGKRPRSDEDDDDVEDSERKAVSLPAERSEKEPSIQGPSSARSCKSYTVLYAKPTTKKHKTWDGDGILTVLEDGKEMILRDEADQVIGSTYNYKLPAGFGEGSQLQIGGKVVEIQELHRVGEYKSSAQQNDPPREAQRASSSVGARQPAAVPVFQRNDTSGRSRSNVPVPVNTSATTGFGAPSSPDELQPTLESSSNVPPSGTAVYNVLYAKPTTKKHKTWDGDGKLTIVDNGREMLLRGEDDQILASSYNFKLPEEFGEGSQITVGGKVVEIQDQVSATSRDSAATAITGNSAFRGARPSLNLNREFRQPAAVHFQQPKAVAAPPGDARYSVLYAPPLTGKYPRWEGDATLTVVENGKEITLKDDNGTILETASNFELPARFEEGVQLQLGDKFIEVTRKLD